MSTSPEDTNTTDGTSPDEDAAPSPTENDTPTPEEAFVSGTSARSSSPVGGVFSAETFGVASMLFLVPVLVSDRLPELLAWFGLNSTRPVSGEFPYIQAEVTVLGVMSALAVILGSVSLFKGTASTRAWARWVAAATVLVGIVFALLTVVAFVGLRVSW